MNQTLTVPPGAAPERLDVFLASTASVSRSQAAKLITLGAVMVNGQTVRPSYKMEGGDTIVIQETKVVAAPTTAPDLPIVYEDEAVIIVDKPAGLVVHPGAGTHGTSFVSDFARLHSSDDDAERPGIVHRLDRDTSGLLIIAKTTPAKIKLQAAFKNRTVHKTYLLLALGRLTPAAAVINLPMGRNPKKPLEQAISAGGREAVTAYKTLTEYAGYSLVEAQPKTGRTHQLRVHFAALGHSIAGDTTYGNPRRPLGLKRHFLHAAAIEFTSPTGQAVSVKSALPPDLASVVEQLENGMKR